MSLNDAKIRSLKPSAKPFKVFDPHGLYLLVNPGGSRLWYLKYHINGKESRLGLGAYPDVSLAYARQRRVEWIRTDSFFVEMVRQISYCSENDSPLCPCRCSDSCRDIASYRTSRRATTFHNFDISMVIHYDPVGIHWAAPLGDCAVYHHLAVDVNGVDLHDKLSDFEANIVCHLNHYGFDAPDMPAPSGRLVF